MFAPRDNSKAPINKCLQLDLWVHWEQMFSSYRFVCSPRIISTWSETRPCMFLEIAKKSFLILLTPVIQVHEAHILNNHSAFSYVSKVHSPFLPCECNASYIWWRQSVYAPQRTSMFLRKHCRKYSSRKTSLFPPIALIWRNRAYHTSKHFNTYIRESFQALFPGFAQLPDAAKTDSVLHQFTLCSNL